MKTQIKLGVAALAFVASSAAAQSGNGSDVTVSAINTVQFSPPVVSRGGGGAGNAGGVVSNTSTATAPANTQLSLPSTPPSLSGVISGNAGSVATFTSNLTTAGVPQATAQGIANALVALGGGSTFGNVAAAVTAWNTAVAGLNQQQMAALISSPQAKAAFNAINAARRSAILTVETR